MAHGDAREGIWRGNWRMEWVASTLHTTSEHGVSSITTADAHTSAASSRLNWRPCRFKWTRPFRRKTKSGFCACAITFQLASLHGRAVPEHVIKAYRGVDVQRCPFSASGLASRPGCFTPTRQLIYPLEAAVCTFWRRETMFWPSAWSFRPYCSTYLCRLDYPCYLSNIGKVHPTTGYEGSEGE